MLPPAEVLNELEKRFWGSRAEVVRTQAAEIHVRTRRGNWGGTEHSQFHPDPGARRITHFKIETLNRNVTEHGLRSATIHSYDGRVTRTEYQNVNGAKALLQLRRPERETRWARVSDTKARGLIGGAARRPRRRSRPRTLLDEFA